MSAFKFVHEEKQKLKEKDSGRQLMEDYCVALDEHRIQESMRLNKIQQWKQKMKKFTAEKFPERARPHSDYIDTINGFSESQNVEHMYFMKYWAYDAQYKEAHATTANIGYLGYKTCRDQVTQQLFPFTELPKCPVWTHNISPYYWKMTNQFYDSHSRNKEQILRLYFIRLRKTSTSIVNRQISFTTAIVETKDKY